MASTQSVIDLLNNRYEEGKKQRQQVVRQWYINLAYLVGYQWIYWNSVTRRLELRYIPKNKVQMVSNQILPIFATAVAKLTKNPPKFETGSPTKDPEDIVSAMTARKIVNHYWRHLELDSESDLFSIWLVSTGNAFVWSDWNKDAGRKMEIPLKFEGELMGDPKYQGLPNPATGMPYQEGETLVNPETGQPFTYFGNEGDIAVSVVSPFQVFIPKGTQRFEHAPWMLNVRDMTEREVKDTFGNSLAKKIHWEVKEKEAPVERSIFHKLHTMMGSPGSNTDDETKVEDKSVTVIESWDKPRAGEEEGLYLLGGGGQIFHKGTYQHEGLGYPIKHCYYHRMPGMPWGKGLIEDEIPLQKQYNKRLSQIIEAINEISRPKILLPFGCEVSPLAFTKNAGEKIKYNPLAGEPKYLAVQDMPQSLFADLENIKKDMQQIAGLHEVSHADVPASVRSGVAISFLQETDDTRLGKITKRIEDTWAKVGKHVLFLVQNNVSEKRVGKVLGDDREMDVFMFKGSDIRDNIDVYVQSGSAFPQNQMLKQQFIKELYDGGLLPPDIALRLLEIEGSMELRKGVLLDMRVAKLENEFLSQGQMVPPDIYEDVQVHLEIHGDWLKANKFAQNPAYQVVMQHYMMTIQMMQMMMGGAPQGQGQGQAQIQEPQPPQGLTQQGPTQQGPM